MSCILCRGSMCFRSPTKSLSPVPCASRSSAQTQFYGGGCSTWVHKRCSGISGYQKPGSSSSCKRCALPARPDDGRPMTQVTVGREKLDVVPPFCYLRGLLLIRKWLWARSYQNMPCSMGQIHWAPASLPSAHLPPLWAVPRNTGSTLAVELW